MVAKYTSKPLFKSDKDLDQYYDYIETFDPSQISRAYETERILNKPRDERSNIDWVKDAARRRGEKMGPMSPARKEYLRQWAQYNARQNALNNARSPEEYTKLMTAYYGEPKPLPPYQPQPIDVDGLYASLQKGLSFMNSNSPYSNDMDYLPPSIKEAMEKHYYGGD